MIKYWLKSLGGGGVDYNEKNTHYNKMINTQKNAAPSIKLEPE